MSQRYRLLWVDMTLSRRDPEVAVAFESLFDIYLYQALSSLQAAIAEVQPSLLCFDFDFPTKRGLQTFLGIKDRHPELPILMLTVQHSEALAVWAFRAKAWDYLVKPIAIRELERCLMGIREMLGMRALQPVRRTPAMARPTIPDENRVEGPRGSSPLVLAPAIDYVERDYRDKVSSAQAAKLCGLTTFQLSRLFKETFGLTFQDYLMRFRIREACRLLKNSAAIITEVGYLVGFNDPSYFGKVFKRYMDCTPSQFHSSSRDGTDLDQLAIDLGLGSSRGN